MNKTMHNLLQQAAQVPSNLITDDQVRSLPEPVQRYLRYAQVIGKTSVRTVHLRQKGFMKLKPGQQWLPMVAEQCFTTYPPAFAWYGTLRLFPLVWASATDQFIENHGSLRIRLWSLIPLGNVRGPEIDQGELQRYLGEMIWFPTSWLSASIEWQAIDACSVRTTMRQGEVTASAVLHFNEKDQLTRITMERYQLVDGRSVLTPWEALAGEYKEVAGLRIPGKVEAMWKLQTGDFSYFRATITEIEYNLK